MRIGRVERAWAAEALRPAVGWKVWAVEHDIGRTRLRSVLYGDLWPARGPFRAACGRLLRTPHDAPFEDCECGVHAGRELAAWQHYLAVGDGNRVFGRVLLWGATIEGSAGWRSAQARPVEIFVPASVPDSPAVTAGLRAYDVPVHLLRDPSETRVHEAALVQ
jgi:hypothetical protein